MKTKLFKRNGVPKTVLYAAVSLLILSVVLAVLSIYPVFTGGKETSVLIDDSFRLTSGETRRQGLGSFHGGENISLLVQGENDYPKNFSIITYSWVNFSTVSKSDITYSFIAGADYYEAVFYANKENASNIHFEISVEKPVALFPFSALADFSKTLFIVSLGALMVATLSFTLKQSSKDETANFTLPSLSKKGRQRLLVLLLMSLTLLLTLLVVNTNSLAAFENWYTDHARHPYESILFLKTGFSVFSTPLGQLASSDSSFYKFVTWPEMPHLYPLGSIFLFLPFGYLLQNGFDPVLVYKMEIAVFLVFAHVCLYFFLKYFWKKDVDLPFRLMGVYIIYVLLVVYSANGMFDAVPFLFSLFALTMFLTKRYDCFILLVAASLTLKYQAGIFLFPLIIIGLLELYRKYGFKGVVKNRAVVAGVFLASVSLVTAYLSAPFLLETRPQLIMNGVNAFSSHSQIPWWLQSFAVLLMLAATLIYAFYMLNKNSLMSLAAVFLLLPSFTMPYIQNWYLPFLFIYALIPVRKKELAATMVWLIFMVAMLSFGGASFNPLQILSNLKTMLKL
jgi:hypothetical protein